MEHFKIFASFEEFFPHLKSGIKPIDRQKVSILYKPITEKQDIYISTEEEKIKEVISKKFDLTPCGSPFEIYKENETGWMVRGNPSLMQRD